MLDAPCGCDLAEESEVAADPRVRDAKAGQAAHWQAVWKCPRGRPLNRDGTEPSPAADPVTDPRALPVLQAVTRVTGAEGLCTCPLYYARLDWVADTVRLRRWYKTGQLGLRVPHPSGPLVDALDCIEDSLAAREVAELQALQEKHSASPARPPPMGPPKP